MLHGEPQPGPLKNTVKLELKFDPINALKPGVIYGPYPTCKQVTQSLYLSNSAVILEGGQAAAFPDRETLIRYALLRIFKESAND